MNFEDDLDFEEEDFGNVDSMLYESIDENKTCNDDIDDQSNDKNDILTEDSNEESDNEPIDRPIGTPSTPSADPVDSSLDSPVDNGIDPQIDAINEDSNTKSSDKSESPDDIGIDPQNSAIIEDKTKNLKIVSEAVNNDSSSGSSWTTSTSKSSLDSNKKDLTEDKALDQLENFLEAFEKSPLIESKTVVKVQPKPSIDKPVVVTTTKTANIVTEKSLNVLKNKKTDPPIDVKQSSKVTEKLSIKPIRETVVPQNKAIKTSKLKSSANESSKDSIKRSDNLNKSLEKPIIESNKRTEKQSKDLVIKSNEKEKTVSLIQKKSQQSVDSNKSNDKSVKKIVSSDKQTISSNDGSNKKVEKLSNDLKLKASAPSAKPTLPFKPSALSSSKFVSPVMPSIALNQSKPSISSIPSESSIPLNKSKSSLSLKPLVPITKSSSSTKSLPSMPSMPSMTDLRQTSKPLVSKPEPKSKPIETKSKKLSPMTTSIEIADPVPEPVPEPERESSPVETIVSDHKSSPVRQTISTKPSSNTKLTLQAVKPSQCSTSSTSLDSSLMSTKDNTSTTRTASQLRKTLELDQKYYNSIRNYLTKGIIFGYNEETFREECKKFKLDRKDGKTLYLCSKQVVETEEQQKEISIRFHLNKKGKANQQHRGLKATKRAVENKYFWGTIEYDIKNVITQCPVCNPKEFELMSFQLWKFIEVGVIDDVIVVRDLNKKSSIFNCAVLEDLSPQSLSKHMIGLFQTYGTPNAIRMVLPKESQKQFTEEFREFLRQYLLEFTEDVQKLSKSNKETDAITLTMVDIKVIYGDEKCPNSDRELQAIDFDIVEGKDLLLLSVFSCNKWLINSLVFNSISKNIKNFHQMKDWRRKVSTLTLFFQINETNLTANEDMDSKGEQLSQKDEKKITNWKEVERLQSDFFTSKPSKSKRQNKANENLVSSESELESEDDNRSINSSKHSIVSNRKRNNSCESNQKVIPFRQALRASQRSVSQQSSDSQSIEIIDVDDESSNSQSNHSLQSQPILYDSKTQLSQSTTSSSNSQTTGTSVSETSYATNVENLPKNYDTNEKAIDGKIKFNLNEDKDRDREEDRNIRDIIKINEMAESRQSDCAEQQMEQPLKDNNQTKVAKSRDNNSENILGFNSLILKELENRKLKSTERKVSIELQLSEPSSEDSANEETTESRPKTKPDAKIKPTADPKFKSSQIAPKNQTSVTPRTQRKRKARKSSDVDSDYDSKNDEISDSRTQKRKRIEDNKNKSNLKSVKKNKSVKISKQRVVSESESSESEASDTNEEIQTNIENQSNSNNKTLEVFQCMYCDFNTNEKKQLILHTTKHRNEKQNKVYCPVCTEVFFNKSALDRHKEEVHPPETRNTVLYGCDDCNCKGFECESIEALNRHLHDTHVESLDYLRTTSSKYRCALCKTFAAATREQICTHLSQKHRSFKCAFDCQYIAQNFQTLERHAKSSHSRFGKPFECKYCDYSSAVFGSLVQHKEQKHAIEWTVDQKSKCCLCDTSFGYDDSGNILEHLVNHCMNFAFFVCKLCQKRCRKLEQIRNHCTTHHAVGPDESVKCIENLDQLFEDLINQVKERDNQLKKSQSTANEMQSAIAGLMEEEFTEEPTSQLANDVEVGASAESVDPLAAALHSAFDDNYIEENPTIRIPEDEEYGFIQEDEDGQWLPVGVDIVDN